MQKDAPLILTLAIDEASFEFFDSLRKKYFPPAINYLSAHLTLFHHLPADEPAITRGLEEWSGTQSPLLLHVTEVKSIGRGVAYKIDCPELLNLHKQMQQAWDKWLTPQDKQKRWPHVTVQNKVSPAEAKETLQALRASFQPFTALGNGFRLWLYKGGPWEFLQDYHFKAA